MISGTRHDHAAMPPIEAILPHRGTMLLLDAVLACEGDTVTARARVAADAWYADERGAMPAWIGIELMAQTIAAHISLTAMRAGGEARHGVLLGTRRYTVHQSAFDAGATLEVRAQELLRSDAGHSAYGCSISIGAVCVAEADIKVYQPTDFQSFLEGSLNP